MAATTDPTNATRPPRRAPKNTPAAMASSSSGTNSSPAATNAAIPIHKDDGAVAMEPSECEEPHATAAAATSTTPGRIHRRNGLRTLVASTAGTNDSAEDPNATGS